MLDAVHSAISSVSPRVLSARLNAILTIDARVAFSKLNIPILYIEAKQDRLVDPLCLEEMRMMNPTMVVKSLTASHLVLQQEPGLAANAIAKFIESILP